MVGIGSEQTVGGVPFVASLCVSSLLWVVGARACAVWRMRGSGMYVLCRCAPIGALLFNRRRTLVLSVGPAREGPWAFCLAVQLNVCASHFACH